MSILSDFEDRIAGAVEGLFAGAFRSPVQPAEIAKALGKAMDDSRAVGVGRVYAPTSYGVALSSEDADNLGGFLPTLSGELATYVAGRAREREYYLSDRPNVEFFVHDDLKVGQFRVRAHSSPSPDEAPSVARPLLTPRKATGMATVTIEGTPHDIALRGERMVVGRLAECDICLDDANASRTHAAFVAEGDQWAIEDAGSTNGTVLNGERIESRRPLADGDVVQIGLTRLFFHQTEE